MTDSRFDTRDRARAALLAGFPAIVLNSLALAAADLVPLATAHGGLLRLLMSWLGGFFTATGLPNLWAAGGLPTPDRPLFQAGFHIVVGLAMAFFYGFAAEPVLRGRPWHKGLHFAAGIWLLNATVILPLTGEGFAGRVHLTLAGMAWFAAAHTLFFVLLAVLYAHLREPKKCAGQVE